MSEQWKPIPGFVGLYEASTEGRVRSLSRTVRHRYGTRRVAGRILTGTLTRGGYVEVTLHVAGKPHRRLLHRVIAETFHGAQPTERHEVRHLDGDKRNNAPRNLAWGTRSENNYDLVRHGSHANAAKTHCPHGHPYNAMNTYVDSRGSRNCRTCRRRARTAWKAANREQWNAWRRERRRELREEGRNAS